MSPWNVHIYLFFEELGWINSGGSKISQIGVASSKAVYHLSWKLNQKNSRLNCGDHFLHFKLKFSAFLSFLFIINFFFLTFSWIFV